MPIVDVEDVLPLPLKIGTEGIVFVHPLLGVDPTRTKIYELKLLVNGDPHDVTNYLLARATGAPTILDIAEMNRVLEKFKSYGANAQTAG
ncbi:hypothetical protein [Verminephrobacter aporrectodeae]|uniref:hypothetical protein n=1 Tax=Verminephrobacter aporrectodeae TaxID=1110389 RepID=UPI002243C0DA|nr:hypothetical protein [Verminephrobacter aporrectodeae]